MATWFKWFENTTNDPKFKLVARRSGQPLVSVIGVWAATLERASEAKARGDISGLIPEVLDCQLDLEDGSSAKILEEMEAIGLIHDGRVAAWDNRQGTRATSATSATAKTSTERSREYRQRRKAQSTNTNNMQQDLNQCDADATQCNDNATLMQRNATQCNADATTATDATLLDKIREDKMRVKEQEANASSPEPSGEAPGTRQGESEKEPSENEEPKKPKAKADEPVTEFTITLNSGEEYSVTQKDFDSWQTLYPNVNVSQELRNMRGWCDANPSRRKTKSGIKRFINGWLSREQNDSRTTTCPSYQPQGQPSCPTEHQLHMQEQRLLKERLLGMIHQKEGLSNQQTLNVTATSPQTPLLGGANG